MYILFGYDPVQTWFCAPIQSMDKVIMGHKTVLLKLLVKRLVMQIDNVVVCVCHIWASICVLCTQRTHFFLAWFRGGARSKPHSQSTVVWTWWKWAPSASPSGCGTFQLSLLSVKALFYDSLSLFLPVRKKPLADHEGNSWVGAAESRGGQLKDKALLQESLRGEERGTRKLF